MSFRLRDGDLYKNHDNIIKMKKDTYDRITRMLVNTIKRSAGIGELLCFFEIPCFIFGSGHPIVNVEYCANYVMNELHKLRKDIKTCFIPPNIILADWRRQDDYTRCEKLIRRN